MPMENDRIFVPYNLTLGTLEKTLAGVKKPGDYFVQGFKAAPIPRLEVNGVGLISFPVPKEQVQKMIQKAQQAPYGRGQETLVDVSVRKVWQLSPNDVKISGPSWEECFGWILSRVKEGLGCQDVLVTAELYKLLIYEEGCFFLTHRDTEKTAGMFGTLVISLPCPHRGGELVIHHAGREAVVDLSAADISELGFTAFYADCEHEVKLIQEGNRVCLVYNLIQTIDSKQANLLTAPLYTKEIDRAASILKKHLFTDGATKIAWLLEHQYSSAELSFNTLKNGDAALAKVLCKAADQSGCTIHLGIVHIEEEGSAETDYGYSRNRYRYDEEEDYEDEDSDQDFEIVEVTNKTHYIDGWLDIENHPQNFGQVPLEEGELLPHGALDGEPPDEQRLTESTGNEGASFERSYHRAAFVIWHSSRYIEVLLQSGIQAAVSYLKKQLDSGSSKEKISPLINRVLDHWELVSTNRSTFRRDPSTNRLEMLTILSLLNGIYLERFVANIIIPEFDGSEGEALAEVSPLLDQTRAKELFLKLVSVNMGLVPNECVKFTLSLAKVNHSLALQVANAVVDLLKESDKSSLSNAMDRWRAHRSDPISAPAMSALWSLLKTGKSDSLRNLFTSKMITLTTVFDPEKIVIPILRELNTQHGDLIKNDPDFVRLCTHAATFLLKRSSYPPEPPKNWSQEISISCSCEDCKELQNFARDPVTQVYRFRVRQERRRHLHEKINLYKLDMTHETERTGSPQTLVCKKNRRTYELRCEQYRSDLSLMQELTSLLIPSNDVHTRLEKAIAAGESLVAR